VAPIASCPPPRLASKDAGAGEARYGGVADTKLSKSEIAASAFGGLAMTNERAADLRHLYLPALVGNAGTGAVTQVQAIRGLCRVNSV